MADDTNTDDALGPLLTDLAKYGVGAAGSAGANAATQSAYQAIIKNLQDRFGDYSNLKTPDYKDITAQTVGPSALQGIQNDAQSRTDQQGAIAQLDDIAKSGGLTLADKTALNQVEQTLSRNSGARNASLADQYAARGQLGSGQQLAMQLANNQNANEQANQRGESVAAEAQKRAMQAIIEKGQASRSMSNDDYARKKAAAEATDSIARYNASMSTDASKYNNSLLGQSYGDKLRKLQGETGLTDSLNSAVLGSGKQNANTIAGAAYGGAGLLNSLSGATKGLGKGGGGGGGGSGGSGGSDGGMSPDDLNGYPSSDETGGRGGAADLTGGATDAGDAVDTAGATDAVDWSSLLGDAGGYA